MQTSLIIKDVHERPSSAKFDLFEAFFDEVDYFFNNLDNAGLGRGN